MIAPAYREDLLRAGPFVNEDGDIWVPVSVGGIVAARRVAGEAAMSRFRFVAMENDVRMSVHEFGDSGCLSGDRCSFAPPCTWTGRAYHFRETGE